jgi:hypothetical protein
MVQIGLNGILEQTSRGAFGLTVAMNDSHVAAQAVRG